MDMMTLKSMARRPELLLALTLLACSSAAQEAQDDLLPAVDTSATAPSGVEDRGDAVRDELSGEITRGVAGDQVMDTLELGRTEITGNQELPKVLYIVPWKKSDPGDLMGKPVNSLLDEVLAPIDREEFLRQVDFYDDLHDSDNE